MDYKKFIESKQIKSIQAGFEVSEVNPMLFDYQRDIVKWACRKGRAAIFADCGMGKTPMQLEWANQVHNETNKPVLILAPLAVSKQTQREGEKFGIDVNICRTQKDVINGINVTNYEKLHNFDCSAFAGIVLDESSILKSFTGKIRTEIIDSFINTPYKLACTATPAPNDYMELGNHAEFLGVMSRTEMLAMYFVHDGGDTSKWRLKGHAESKYWEWVATWAAVLKKPSDLGYSDEGFILPELNIQTHFVESETDEGMLVVVPAQTLQERREARKKSLEDRVQVAADLINNSNEQWLVWCDFNAESELLSKTINYAVEVKGADSPEHKEDSMIRFATGEIKALVTKPSIAGFGMNWQNCNNMIFCGLSDSYEQFYQAVRRCWRFGQKKPVNVHIIISEKEESVLLNIKRKEEDAQKMAENMVKYTAKITAAEIHKTKRDTTEYKPDKEMIIPKWLKGVA